MLITSRQKAFLLGLLITQISYLFLEAQTVINGKVTDAQTFEPVVFANVIFKGTSIGVITDFDGNYSLSGNKESDSIEVSFIGYDSKTIEIKPDTIQIVDVQLHPAIYALDEIKVTPGENRAHILLRKVWKNSENNNIEKLAAYQYENYSRTTVYLRKFSNNS
ncbi:MAG: carboxypeptidase-like regulatory domain-containing protein, partial [Cyclobacteriaceae bacterium]|nr:carboxypeptidase-like regulatory domain-containing protein [Cyclobacteriaceae bacterium]